MNGQSESQVGAVSRNPVGTNGLPSPRTVGLCFVAGLVCVAVGLVILHRSDKPRFAVLLMKSIAPGVCSVGGVLGVIGCRLNARRMIARGERWGRAGLVVSAASFAVAILVGASGVPGAAFWVIRPEFLHLG